MRCPVHTVKSGVYANDDNRRAERGMMGSLGTPGDQARKLLENALEMGLEMGLEMSLTLEKDLETNY